MSILNSTQLREMYQIPATVYYIHLYKTLDKREFLRLCENIRYYCQKDDISYLLGFSKTDSKSAKIKYLKTGKRGRPQRIITGKKVDGHCHNAFIGTQEKSCRKTVQRIYKAYNIEEQEQAKKEHREPIIIPHFSVHNLRHTFCTRFCENESNIKVIQEIMGHSDISTTMNIYAEATENKKKEVFSNLEGKIKIC